jgi:hypothetical protein
MYKSSPPDSYRDSISSDSYSLWEDNPVWNILLSSLLGRNNEISKGKKGKGRGRKNFCERERYAMYRDVYTCMYM